MPQANRKRQASQDREELFDKVTTNLLWCTNLPAIADEAGVHLTTLYNWIECRVHAPRIDTLFPVARALGYEIKIIAPKAKKRAKLRRVK